MQASLNAAAVPRVASASGRARALKAFTKNQKIVAAARKNDVLLRDPTTQRERLHRFNKINEPRPPPRALGPLPAPVPGFAAQGPLDARITEIMFRQ